MYVKMADRDSYSVKCISRSLGTVKCLIIDLVALESRILGRGSASELKGFYLRLKPCFLVVLACHKPVMDGFD